MLLVWGYAFFLLIMLANLLGSALVVLFLDTDPRLSVNLPWLTPKLHYFIILVFVNSFWIMHFSFTSIRLLNMKENRKLLGFNFPLRKLAWYLNVIGFFHPINLVYNFTWLIFLLIQVQFWYQIPVVILAIVLNYSIIYSIKHRFLKVVEKRFAFVVFGFLFLIFIVFQGVSLFSDNARAIFFKIIPSLDTLNHVLSLLPGGLILQSAKTPYSISIAGVILLFGLILVVLVILDHFNKTKEGLLNPTIKDKKKENGLLWKYLKKFLGPNAGKFYYYVMTHPYNRIQFLTITLIPVVYIPLLLQLPFGMAAAVLIPTMFAAIPVALLAMGMANMYGYEHRELLLHLQFPVALERQLKERFLGVITLPLLIFYLITILELLVLPELGQVWDIFISNTFFFLCFMLLFVWSSSFQYQRVNYSSSSFKHPIFSQKVTFIITFMIFLLGYAVFVPIGSYQIYRIGVMALLILAISVYLWMHMDVLATLFRKNVLKQLWTEQ